MATIRKTTTGRFQVRVRASSNKSYTRSFYDEAAARAWAVELAAHLRAARGERRRRISSSFTLGEALNRYLEEVSALKKSASYERKTIRRWQAHPLASLPLGEIRGADLARHKQQRLQAGIAGNTIRLELALFSHLYTVARTDWGMDFLTNPVQAMSMPKVARGRDRRLKQGELESLVDYCQRNGDWKLAAAIELAVETAMRRGELAHLLWADVDMQDRTAHLDDTKNSSPRTVPLSMRAMAVLEGLDRKEERVLGLSPDKISQRFHASCTACGIEGLRFHDLRHEAVSRLFEKGFNMMEVSTISGHKAMQMLKRYTHLDARRLLDRLG